MHHKSTVRLTARILAGVFFLLSVLVGAGIAETAERPSYAITAVLDEDIEALRVTQRLDYTNTSSDSVSSVLFAVYGNMYRRESSLIYENADLLKAFPAGYAPGGFRFDSILVNGESADWGVQGEDELLLRVSAPLAPGESCVFTFEYLLLVTQNGGFLGSGYDDWRLTSFYPTALLVENGEFASATPTSNVADFTFCPLADYTLSLTLPEGYRAAACAPMQATENADATTTYTLSAPSRRTLAVSFSLRFREYTAETPSGTRVTLFANDRSAPSVLAKAVETVSLYESWFGPFPHGQITLAQSDWAMDFAAYDGLILLNQGLFSDAKALTYALDVTLAKQYFGWSAYFMPTEDAWLSDAVAEYLHYLAVESRSGRDAFLAALNEELLPAIQFTVPGGLRTTYDASLFSNADYDVIVRQRGALILHQLRSAMGLEDFLSSLSLFHQMGASTSAGSANATGRVLGEYDFVAALDQTTGSSWEAFLTDWIFTIDENIDHTLFWIE